MTYNYAKKYFQIENTFREKACNHFAYDNVTDVREENILFSFTIFSVYNASHDHNSHQYFITQK